VNGEDDRHTRPEWRGVGRRVNQVDARTCRRAREADESPAKVGGRVWRLGEVADTAWQPARIGATQGDDLGGVIEPDEGARKTFDIPADAGSRGAEGAAVEPNPQSVDQRSSMLCAFTPMRRGWA
jgi:hypothetical protein